MDTRADRSIVKDDNPLELLICGKGVAIKSVQGWMYETKLPAFPIMACVTHRLFFPEVRSELPSERMAEFTIGC